MDRELLKNAARQALEKAKASIVEGRIDPAAQIIFEDGRIEDVPAIPGVLMDRPELKSAVFKVLAMYCAAMKAAGLIIVSDGWTLEFTEDQNKRFFSDPKYRAERVAATQRDGLVKAAASGWGKLREVVSCNVQTKDYIFILAQYYERWAADGLIPPTAVVKGNLPPHTVKFIGEPTVVETGKNGRVKASGRIFSLYEGEPDGK